MQCSQCGFENMPGLERCGRCRCVLAVPATLDVHPPRAGFGRGFRAIGNWTRRRLASMRLLPVVRVGTAGADAGRAAAEPVLAGAVSVVPGLWHLATGNLSRVRSLWPAWLALLFVGLFLAGTTAGSWLVGTAIAVHAVIVCDAADVRRRAGHWSARVAVTLLAFAALAFFPYTVAARFARGHVSVSLAGVDMPEEALEAGDGLLVWASAYRNEDPQRGDLAVYDIRPASGPGYRLRGARLATRVLGLPGDRVCVAGDGISVTDPNGNRYAYASPSGLGAQDAELELHEDEYFCLPPELRVAGGRGAPSPAERMRMTAVARRRDFRGRALMVWNPLSRRRFLRRTGLPLIPEDGK
jgi:hypothetical protein